MSLPETSARAIAARVLTEAEAGTFVDEVLDRHRAAATLDARDRGLLTTLVFGVMRWRRTLDFLIDACARQVDPDVRQHLRIALFQMRHLERIPRHAAVNEAVELVKRGHGKRVAGFANAVLRRAADLPLPQDLGVRFSHPEWLVRRWAPRYGERLPELLAANNAILPLTARTNRLRAPAELGGPVIELDGDPTKHPGFAAGFFTVQDETFTRVAPVLDPKPGERVLDLCAAPGGKTTHLAELMEDRGEVIAVDLPERIGVVEESARRLRLSSIRCVPGDGTQIAFPAPFDAILVDAPCSNTGVLARRPDARWRLAPGDIAKTADLQRRLLAHAATLLKPGGRLLYVTCSLEPEENDVAASLPGFALLRREDVLPTTRHSGAHMSLFHRPS